MKHVRVARAIAVCGLLFLPALAEAQSSMAGVVRDTSGGVLPGVTVEATSPALIGGARTAVTDDQGLYRIVDLRPGPYTLTFTLSGFNSLRREGIDLPAEFTATVNVEMAVGALQETVTVTGQAPLVDIRSSGAQTQIQRETMDSLPGTGRLSVLNAIIPGASLTDSTERAAGGSDRTQQRFSVHGTPQATPVVDGLNLQVPGQDRGVFVFSQLNVQEVVVSFTGDAEADQGGAQIKMVPRDGGNRFSGGAQFAYSGSSMESSNASGELLARGLNPGRIGSLKKFRETGVAVGGPIRQNRLWFYASAREGVNQQWVDGVQWNKLQQPASLLYEPDFSRRVFTNDYSRDMSVRLTWQASPKNKVVFGTSQQPNCICTWDLLSPTTRTAPEAGGPHAYAPNYNANLTWTNTLNERILLEAGHSSQVSNQVDDREDGWDASQYRITDQGLNLVYGNVSTRSLPRRQFQERFAASYVTGSHQFKTGATLRHTFVGDIEKYGHDIDMNGPAVEYRFTNGVPNQLTLLDAPWNYEEQVRDLALFAQDQWTIHRLTLNLGLRFNDVRGSTPLQVLPAGKYVPERRLEALENVPAYQNLSPRLGGAYDLFGDGRTAIKATLGHYPEIIRSVTGNPASGLTRSTNRTWNDANRNYVPDCDLRSTAANGECGAWSDLSFGRADRRTQYEEGLLEGFNRQYHNWQTSVSLQQQLTSRLALNVGYFRTWYGGDSGGAGVGGATVAAGLTVTDNTLVAPGDYSQYCITAPTDSHLPGGGGNRLCGLYDLNPSKFGQVNNVVRSIDQFGERSRVYNGVDVSLNARFGQGGQLSLGSNIGRTVTDDCFVVDSPQAAREGFCRTERRWKDATDLKLLMVYPLPWSIQTSAIYQNSPGIPITANLVVSNATVKESLGRNLAACGTQAVCNATVTIPLIPNDSMFEERHKQLDLRFTRAFTLGARDRVRANLDIYNVLNASTVLAINTTYGSAWRNVTQMLSGRLLRVGVQWDF